MFNNLGIYSGGFPQGPMRPGCNFFPRGPRIAAVQFAGNNRGFGFVNTGSIPAPPLFLTVSATSPQITTVEDGTVIVDSMSLIWPIDSNALATFTANYSIIGDLIDITARAAADTAALAVELAALPSDGPLGAVLGNGQIITPGVYDIVTPAAIQGVLTFDAQGDPDAIFVIRVNGALTSVAGSTIVLINGADAANIFWTSQGATALGANTTFSGTALAVGGAAGIGNSSTVDGRLLSTVGAVTTDTSVVTDPGATTTPITLGVLESFALFTVNGAVSNTGTSVINGNIGTNLGIISGFGLPTIVNGNVYIPGSLAAGPVSAEFGIYVNGVLVPASLVTVSGPTTIPAGTVNTSATIPLLIGDVVTAESTVLEGTMTVTNRTLSLLQVP
jgi:hypothetical protein